MKHFLKVQIAKKKMSRISVSYESKIPSYSCTRYEPCILVVSLFKSVLDHFVLKKLHVSKLWLSLTAILCKGCVLKQLTKSVLICLPYFSNIVVTMICSICLKNLLVDVWFHVAVLGQRLFRIYALTAQMSLWLPPQPSHWSTAFL